MILIGKSPYRISLLGGGSDLDWFIEEKGYGFSLGYTLDKFSYSVVNKLPENSLEGIIKYSSLETYKNVDDIIHPLIRESFKKLKIESHFEISTFGFAQGGSGIGGSSSFLLSLIIALAKSQNIEFSPIKAAEYACDIEINRLNKPIGRQDQYICAIGGISSLKFEKNGNVTKNSISKEKYKVINNTIENLYLIPSRKTRKADSILSKLQGNPLSIDQFKEIRELAKKFILTNETRESHLTEILHSAIKESWKIKSEMSNVMNDNLVNTLNNINKHIPNQWIRLLGAGSGGYFLVCLKEDIKNPSELFISNGFENVIKASKTNEGVSINEL